MKLLAIFWTLLTLFLSLLLLCDAFFHPAFTLKHLHLDSHLLFLLYLFVTLALNALDIPLFPKKVSNLNKRVVFPSLVVIAILFIFLDRLIHANFVFTRFHFHPYQFIYLPILSGMIIYVSKKLSNPIQKLFYFIPPISLIVMYFILLVSEGTFEDIVREDSILEQIQFLFYLLASFFSFKTFLLFKKSKKTHAVSLFFIVLSVTLFFVAGEEISWGQRYLGIDTPEAIKNANFQKELTVHNLKPFQKVLHLAYILIGLYGAFSRLLVTKFFPTHKNLLIFTPPFYLFFCFFSLACFYYVFTYGPFSHTLLAGRSGNVPPHSWQEVMETFLALGFFGYTYFVSKNKV